LAKIYDALRQAGNAGAAKLPDEGHRSWESARDFRVVSVISNKGGVGKTTLAMNLSVYARALREDSPVLLFGFDDQTTLDRMFAIDPPDPGRDITAAFAEGSFRGVARLGQYGVDYVPSSRDIADVKRQIEDSSQLRRMLMHSDRKGLVVIDTKNDFEILTRAAIDASDLVVVVVKDQASLIEARRVFEHLAASGRPPEVARILLSLVDLRIKYRDDEDIDVLGYLVSEIRRAGYPLFETFVSRSPKVESLYTNPAGRAVSVLHGAAGSIVHRQLRGVTEEVLKALRLD
jgi:chromosome partitioning protein